nr:hypothetical protein CFP56_01594 [Quercus suber]
MKSLVHGTTMEYWASKVERVLVSSRHPKGYAISNMQLYWRKVISTFIDFVNSREVDQVVISPPLSEPSTNARLIPNTRNGVRAPKSNLATSATKRSRGKSPPSEDKPKKVKRKRASSENPKTSSPKAPAIVPSGSGAAPATKFSVPVVASANALSPLKQCGRKTSAGRSGDSEETQSEEYDFEDTTADFNKLLSLASISSRVSSPDVLYSLGPTDEDIEMADEGFTIAVTIGDTATGMPSQEHAGKDLVSEIPTEGQALLEEIAAAEACIARDNETMLNELAVKIADLEKEIAAKTVELSLLVSQRDEMMQSSLTRGASSSGETFGDGLLD